MSTLPATLKSKQIQLVWYADLEKWIEEQFGRPFRVLDDGEYSQDELVTFWVEKDPEATEAVNKWLASEPGEPRWPGDIPSTPERPYTSEVLNELANRGVLLEETLYVHVWW